MKDNTYTQNGDMVSEVYESIHSTNVVAGTNDKTMKEVIADADSSSGFSRGLVYIYSAMDFYYSGDSMDGNWFLETDYTQDRAQVVTLEEVYGNIEIGAVTV
jgi:hypothetical protein